MALGPGPNRTPPGSRPHKCDNLNGFMCGNGCTGKNLNERRGRDKDDNCEEDRNQMVAGQGPEHPGEGDNKLILMHTDTHTISGHSNKRKTAAISVFRSLSEHSA